MGFGRGKDSSLEGRELREVGRVIIYFARKIYFHVPVCSRFKRLTLSSVVFPFQNTCSFSAVHTVVRITNLH